MTRIPDSELDRMQQVCDAATKGPWSLDDLGPCDGWQISSRTVQGPPDCIVGDCGDVTEEDGCFIAAARTSLPACIAALREAYCLLDLKCECCGIVAVHHTEDLCHECKHHVCIECCTEYGHEQGGLHRIAKLRIVRTEPRP